MRDLWGDTGQTSVICWLDLNVVCLPPFVRETLGQNVCQMFETYLSLGPSGHWITLFCNVSHTEGFKHLRDTYEDVCHTYSICFNSACNSPTKTRQLSCWCKSSSKFFHKSTSTVTPCCYALMPPVTTLVIFYFLSLLIYLRVSHPFLHHHALSARTITLPTESGTSNQEWNGAGACWGGTGSERRFALDGILSRWVFYIQCICYLPTQESIGSSLPVPSFNSIATRCWAAKQCHSWKDDVIV